MNIIRTQAVELTSIPAIAYKQKLQSGGSGVKIFRTDKKAHAVFTVDRRSGLGVPYGHYDESLFPEEAVDEAVELTLGMPYSARGKFAVIAFDAAAHEPAEEDKEDVTEDDGDAVDMVDSDEYKALVARYCDEKGKMNYTLMNKDFIQFASRSDTVARMVADKALEEDILAFIVSSRATNLTGRKEVLSGAETEGLMETLDEIDPRSAFKETKSYIRRLLARASGRQ